MTFNMVNICVEKKIPKFAIFAKFEKLSCMPKWFTVNNMSEIMFFLFLKISRKPTSPAMRNNEFNSRGLNYWWL